jgi:hypothetical protein
MTNAQWSFYKDIRKPIAEGFTVTFVAMQLAYFMGFKRVFLVGVDHSFKQSGKPNEQQRLDADDQNHFDPTYFQGQNWNLADLEGSEVSFAMAQYYYHQDGREILDATVDGKLMVFPKISFEKACLIAKKRPNRVHYN